MVSSSCRVSFTSSAHIDLLISIGGKEFGSEYDGHVLRVKGVGIGAQECHYAIRFENETYRLFDEVKEDYL